MIWLAALLSALIACMAVGVDARIDHNPKGVDVKATNGFIVTIIGPDEPNEEEAKEVEDILAGRVLGDAEDLINDQLPEGWQAKISEATLVR